MEQKRPKTKDSEIGPIFADSWACRDVGYL